MKLGFLKLNLYPTGEYNKRGDDITYSSREFYHCKIILCKIINLKIMRGTIFFSGFYFLNGKNIRTG